MTNLELHDNDIMMLDELTWVKHDSLFKLIEMPPKPYEKSPDHWSMLTIERELDVRQYERRVYTIFMMLSEVGGLTGILTALFMFFSSIWNYNAFDNYMV